MHKKLRRFLKWSEKYTKTDMVYLASGGFWTTLGYALQVLGGVVTMVALANLIDANTFGTYQFIISTATILGVFTLTGMGLAINRAVAQGRDGAFRAGLRTKLKWSIGITLASGATAGYYFYNDNDTLGTAFLLVGALAPFIESFRLYEPFLEGKRRFKEAAIIGSIRKVLPMIAMVSALFLTDNVVHLIGVYFLSNALSYILMYAVVIYRHRPPLEYSLEDTRFSKHLSVMQLLQRLAGHADKILIFHFLGAAPVATFTIAQLAMRYSSKAVSTVSAVALPKLAVRDLSTLQRTLPRKVLIFSGVMGVAALAYILIVPFLFPILFPAYPEAIALSQVLALTMLFVPRNLYQKALTAHAQTNSLYILQVATPLTKLALLGILLPLYGLWGAVSAILLTNLFSAVLMYVLFKRAHQPEV